MDLANLTQETLDAIKASLSDMRKATLDTSSGLISYDLSGPAKTLYPVLTPLRNKLPRTSPSTAGDTATRWKAITGINTGNVSAGVAEGRRGGIIALTTKNYTAAYATLGLEGSTTDEEQLAAIGNLAEDARARVTESTLRSTMIAEEGILLGGNASNAFGTAPTPVAAVATGGALTLQSGNLLYVVALTPEGFANSSVAAGVPGQISRTNQDGTTDTFGGGNSKVSLASNAVTTSSGSATITGTVAAVPGAAGYAWYLGTSAANAALAAITTTNSVSIAANPAGTQMANDAKVTTDYSTNSLVFDGLITLATTSGNGGYIKSLDGAKLTSDGASGIVEIDAALQWFWDTYKLGPTEILVSGQQSADINKLVLGSTGAPLFRFQMDGNGGSASAMTAVGGSMVGNYLNKFSLGGGQLIPIRLHPNLQAGTILFLTDTLPYPLSNVSAVNQVKIQREYYQEDWPRTTRQYQTGVYVREVLQCFAPFSLGVISNIAKN